MAMKTPVTENVLNVWGGGLRIVPGIDSQSMRHKHNLEKRPEEDEYIVISGNTLTRGEAGLSYQFLSSCIKAAGSRAAGNRGW